MEEQMPTQTLSFTQPEIGIILANGGKITFKPMHRNRLKCNQVPRFKRITPRQAHALRAQVAVHKRGSVKATLVKGSSTDIVDVAQYPKTEIDRTGDARCPACSQWHFSVNANVPMKCELCRKIFVPERRKVQNSHYPQSKIDSDGDAMCPRCNVWNWGVSKNEPTMCRSCHIIFVPVR